MSKKLKASVLDLVGPLMKQLRKEVKNGDTELKDTLAEIVDSIKRLKKCLFSTEEWECKLIGYVGQIQREIDRWTSESDEGIKRSERENYKSEMSKLKNMLKELVEEAHYVASKDDEANHHEDEVDAKGKVGSSSYIGDQDKEEDNNVSLKELIECMKELNPQQRECAYSLGIFLQNGNEKLNRRLLVYWWIGLGLVPLQENNYRTAEQYAEILFDDLMDHGILILDEANELLHNQAIKWCTIKPTLHKQLKLACKKKRLVYSTKRKEGTACFYQDRARQKYSAILNFDQMYLDSKDITEVLDEIPSLQVLQFGWWRRQSEVSKRTETKSKDHIEVDEIDFLKQIGENVIYLSLRGISSIEELPQKIGKLQDLMILDLRACHNLEKLPEKPKFTLLKFVKSKLREVKWFKNLSHLDISECWLLDHMPKWMCELSNLEVLKGFVVGGTVGSMNQFCRIDDLSKLKKLRKLSIKIAKLSEDSMDLEHLEKLSVLTITWRLYVEMKTSSTVSKPGKISFPGNLEKLDIRCYPYAEVIELLTELKILRRLYIRGGNLEKLFDANSNANTSATAWTRTVELLRLRSLHFLDLSFDDLSDKCTHLKCVEYYNCRKLKDFPTKTTCHIFPWANAPEAIDNEPQPPPSRQDSGRFNSRFRADD